MKAVDGHATAPVLQTLAGVPESVGTARRLARDLLGPGHPAADTAVVVVSELVTNAIAHTRSGRAGGTMTIALCPGPAGVLIQVRDDGGCSEPRVSECGDGEPAELAEHGYGLLLVAALADSWGTFSSPDGRVTWCRVSARAVAAEDVRRAG